MDAREIIELVLAILLGMFLVLLIVVTAFIVKIVKIASRASQSFLNIAQDVESMASKITMAGQSYKVIKTIFGIFASGQDRSKKRSKW